MRMPRVRLSRTSLVIGLFGLMLTFLGCRGARPSPATSAPHADWPDLPKGYELYSWQSARTWTFKFVAGTNRVKSYEEVTSEQAAMDVTLTVHSVEDLEAALDQLPDGAHVIWRGAVSLEQIGFAPRDLGLPPDRVIDEVKAYAEQVGVTLDVLP